MRVLRRARALMDLDEIAEYIGQSNPKAALRILPVAGFKKYWIFYRPAKNRIEVLRVLHGARDIDAALEEET